MTLSEKEKKNILAFIADEGVDYTFMEHSSFKEIKDEKFHELLKNWREARVALLTYTGFLRTIEEMCKDPEEGPDDFGL